MSGLIEALHVYDERHHAILSHTFTGQPLAAPHLLPLYLAHPAPRPSVLYLQNTNPATLVFSVHHDTLLFVATSTEEIEPLLVLEFLHRVIDALQEFLGAPLLAGKMEQNYDVIAQLLMEMCEAGLVNSTEPNALRDAVVVEGWMDKLLGSISLPGSSNASSNSPSNRLAAQSSLSSSSSQPLPTVPWRRANVRHTSNELYADIIESLSVTIAPSGRPLAAFAHGSIAFTSKVSGVPDVRLNLTSTRAGKVPIRKLMQLPVFHPCVRLQRWHDSPGELSFVPPDGRFILAGYEVDLLHPVDDASGRPSSQNNSFSLPLEVEVRSGLGPTKSQFEVRVQIKKGFLYTDTAISTQSTSTASPSSSTSLSSHKTSSMPSSSKTSSSMASLLLAGTAPASVGTPAQPVLENLEIRIVLPSQATRIPELRPSKGDATFHPATGQIEWNIPTKDTTASDVYTLRCSVMSAKEETTVEETGEVDDTSAEDTVNPHDSKNQYLYDEPGATIATEASISPSLPAPVPPRHKSPLPAKTATVDDALAKTHLKLMPISVLVDFSVLGWVPSGIKVESMQLDMSRTRGLGESVKPYKGVKYLTLSKNGGLELYL